jgi:phage terminase large subunit-like protein
VKVPKRDYIAIALQYCQDVLAGTIPACKLTKLAVQRHLNDLERIKKNDPTFPYIFDEEAACHVCLCVEMHPMDSGELAGEKIVLLPWQVWMLTTIFGYLQKYTGYRRFRRVYAEIPKGNGKSALTSPVANYMAFCCGIRGAQVYAAAITMQQARVVFNTSANMMKLMPAFMKKHGIGISGKTLDPSSIYQTSSGSFYRPISHDSDSIEGIKPIFTVLDELHVQPNRLLFDNLSKSNGKMKGSLLWAITTAGCDRGTVCYEQNQFVEKILLGEAADETTFGVIYSIETGDDPFNPAVWPKANPSWGHAAVDPEDIAAKAEKARITPGELNGFLRYHLGVWTNADIAALPMALWDKQGNPSLRIEDFVNDECILGIDLASRQDLASVVVVFRRIIEGVHHYYAFQHSWLPEQAIEDSPTAQMQGWVIEGYLESKPGKTIDLARVVPDYVDQLCGKHNIIEIGCDPHKTELIVPRMEELFGPVGTELGESKIISVSPKGHDMCPALKELETLLIEGRFHHAADPLYTWAAGNLAGHVSAKDGSVFPKKKNPQAKIDPIMATLNALRRWTAQSEVSTSGYALSVVSW